MRHTDGYTLSDSFAVFSNIGRISRVFTDTILSSVDNVKCCFLHFLVPKFCLMRVPFVNAFVNAKRQNRLEV